MPEDTKSRIAELEKELYSKDFAPHQVEETLSYKNTQTSSTWDTAGETSAYLSEKRESDAKHHRMIKKLVKISAGFFVIAIAVAGFVWWHGSNIISSENIKITIDKPVAVAGGEPFETKITIANNNKVSIEGATLFIEYPTGFYSVATKAELPRISKELGTIEAGQTVVESISTLLYGQESTQKDVSVTLEYRLTGSNATLKKKTTYAVRISSSPVNLKLTAPKGISSGQEIEFAIEVTSNSQNPLTGLLVDATYPFGFSFRSADPTPTYGNNVWVIDTLAVQEKRVIKVLGVIEGQENEEKSMKISVGTKKSQDEQQIDVVYNVAEETIGVTKPFISLDLAVNGDRSPQYSAPLGRSIRVDIEWQSNNPTRVTDGVIEVVLKGDALNRYSVYADGGGFYRSSDNTIVWDKSTNSALASIELGDKGSMSFAFSPIALSVNDVRTMRNPQITIEARARARDTSGTTSQDLKTIATRTVKFNTDIRLTAQALYSSGPFKNSGPLPPKADTPTTYTIKWAVRNGSNNASNILVKTTLPNYVKWLNQIAPTGEDITYNENTAEVSWNVGRVLAGGAREGAFQISLLPSLSQLGRAPLLTGDSTLSGTDDFTKSALSDRKVPVSTNLSSDPKFSSNQSAVVQ